jgi:AraC-like DNA-binding protein
MSVELQVDSFISIFFTAGAVLTSLGYGFSLLFRKQRTQSNLFLGILLILGSLTLLNSLFANAGIYSTFRYLYFIPLTYTLSFGPLTYFYIQTKIHPGFQFKRIHLLHTLLPAAQAIFYFSIGFRDYEFKSWMWQNVISVWFGDVEGAMFFITFFGYMFAAVKRVKREMESPQSEWKEELLRWLRRFIYIFSTLIAFQFFYDIMDLVLWNYFEVNLYNISWASFPLDISKALVWYWVSFTAFQNAKPERLPVAPTTRKERYQLSDNDLANQLTALEDYFKNQEPHLNPDLNLNVLAKKLDTTPNKVSFILNEGKQISFNDFVNELRVEEVKKRLLDPKLANYTHLTIALEAGFNSKATFYRVFKAKTGMTPKQFAETHS